MFKHKKNKNETVRALHVTSPEAGFAYVEAYKSLRTNLKFVSLNNEYKKIIVTSAVPREGKSNVAINLASSLALDGSKTILIDCDLRNPMVHRYLKIKKTNKGLTTILSGDVKLEEAITVTDSGISAICSGPIPPNPAEILGSAKMKEFIKTLENTYDYILFDTPPVSIVTDAAVLSKYADGVLMVIRQSWSTVEEVKRALQNLTTVNANIIGTVLNDFDGKKTGKSDGYYYYSKDYKYSE